MENKDKIIELIISKKKTPKEMAIILKITERQVHFLLEKWGVQIPRRKYKRVPIPDRETLLRLYEQNKTTSGVSKVMGVGINTIARWMKELKIPTKRLQMSESEKIKLLEYHINRLKI
ncbi:MAG: hypothetical protein M1127_03405 [Patescibacteria group bacterium]|nr:hypothetical protein [Patescibacteria group bacterium]